jgi:hypothetical protein
LSTICLLNDETVETSEDERVLEFINVFDADDEDDDDDGNEYDPSISSNIKVTYVDSLRFRSGAVTYGS